MDLELTPGMRPDVVVPGAAMGRFERFGRDLRTVLPQFELPEFDVRVRRPSGRLGVSVHQMRPQLAEFFDVRTGVLVTEVAEDSPAAKSGVKAGDVITAIDGWTINDAGDLRQRVDQIKPGEKFTIGLVRDRRELTVMAVAEEVEDRRRRDLRQAV